MNSGSGTSNPDPFFESIVLYGFIGPGIPWADTVPVAESTMSCCLAEPKSEDIDHSPLELPYVGAINAKQMLVQAHLSGANSV